MKLIIWTVALTLVLDLASASTFTTNCSLPTERTTFVTAPNTRGTLQILWSSLFTIFICIWSVQHLNVPEQRDGGDASYVDGYPGCCKNGRRSLSHSARDHGLLVRKLLPSHVRILVVQAPECEYVF